MGRPKEETRRGVGRRGGGGGERKRREGGGGDEEGGEERREGIRNGREDERRSGEEVEWRR